MSCSIFVHFSTTSHYAPHSSTRKNPKILTLLTFFIVFIYYYYFTNIEISDQIPPLSFNLWPVNLVWNCLWILLAMLLQNSERSLPGIPWNDSFLLLYIIYLIETNVSEKDRSYKIYWFHFFLPSFIDQKLCLCISPGCRHFYLIIIIIIQMGGIEGICRKKTMKPRFYNFFRLITH